MKDKPIRAWAVFDDENTMLMWTVTKSRKRPTGWASGIFKKDGYRVRRIRIEIED
jgi:hypothetical protein